MPVDTTPDLGDPDLYLAGPPHELFAQLRRDDPVHWQPAPAGGGFWAVLRHADVEHVSRQPDVFSSAAGGVVLEDLPPDRLEQMRGMLLAMDPPRHRQVRRPLVARLTPRRVAALEPAVRAICQDIFAEVGGETEFVGEVAAKLPTRVVGRLMGLPPSDWDHVHALAERITRGQDEEYAGAGAAARASQEMGLYGYQLALDRQGAEHPPDDLTTVLLGSHDPAAFASLFVQLVTAGQDTTATLLSSGLLALLAHPEQLAALRRDPTLVPTAVEEMLRWANPLHYFRRTATRDVRLGGAEIAAGDKVAMIYTSANRDEAVFGNPQAFDITRNPNRHLSFGVAEHFCVGAHLARLEARVFFTELISTFAAIEIAGSPVRLRSNLNNALRSLPVRLAR